MPKLNFNVPFLDINGQEVKQPKINKTKAKLDPNGGMIYDFVKDEEGNLVFETVMLKTILSDTLLAPFKDDEKMEFSDRAIRGKLARKIANSSTANYRDKDIALIKDLAAKSKATMVLLQLEDIINGPDEDYAVTTDAPAITDATQAA